MNIHLPEEAARVVRQQIEAGAFRTAGEVIAAALKRLSEKSEQPSQRFAHLLPDGIIEGEDDYYFAPCELPLTGPKKTVTAELGGPLMPQPIFYGPDDL